MNPKIVFLTLLVLLCGQLGQPTALAQIYEAACGMPPANPIPPQSTPASNYGGRFISSIGTLRVLMVWVRFADDNETNVSWPEASVLPDWAANFVNNEYSPNGNYYAGAVSGYFYENSYGKFHVIGDVYYVTTDYPESHYHEVAAQSGALAARSAIEIEMFDKLDRPPYKVNFTRYDNWTFNHSTGFTHSPVPDNILDMSWFMTRNLHDDNYPPNSPYRFGIGWATLDCNSLTKDGILIKGRDYYFPASGIGMFAPHLWRPLNSSLATVPSYPLVNHVAHEMTHYFFGFDHFAQSVHRFPGTEKRLTSAMTPYSGGWTGHYSGYEKWRLGWLTPTVVNYSADNILLYDQATTIDSTLDRLLKIPIPNTSQYFLVENRRWLSPYESRHTQFGYLGHLIPGIIAYHIVVENDYLTYTVEQKLDADGMFRWKIVYDGPGGLSNDVIDKDVSDPWGGFSETQFMFLPNRGTEIWEATYWPNSGNPYSGGPYIKTTNFLSFDQATTDVHGDQLDLFSVGDVISPWSNPGSHLWNSSTAVFAPTEIGIEITAFDSETQRYALAVRVSNAEQLSPSRPQDLTVSVYSPNQYDNYPRLNWKANQEPDVTSNGRYLIERRVKTPSTGNPNWTAWSQIADVPSSQTQYDDLSLTTAGSGSDSAQYRIRAKDNTNKLSVYSEAASICYIANAQKTVGLNNGVPVAYLLAQNYPNPFNPTTNIQFAIPEDQHVTLKVFNTLGQEVAMLVNDVQQAGTYSVQFDGAKLSSGVYIYTLKAGSFMASKKLVLMK